MTLLSFSFLPIIVSWEWTVESDIQRTIAHGLLNTGLALAKGENAVVQASGAMTGETVGILSHSLYGKTPEELTETEKQNISAWATLTSGIVGGLISDNSTSVANAAQAGKVVVENNAIGAAKPIIKGLEKGYEWCMKNATCRNGLMQLGVNFGLTSAQIQEAMDAGAAARNGDIKAMRNLSPEQVAYIDEQIIHNKGIARLIFGSEPWGGRLGIPSHTGGNQMPDQDRIDTGGNQIPDQGQTDTGGDQISVQIWTDTGGDQIPKPRDNLTETPVPEKPTLDDVVYLADKGKDVSEVGSIDYPDGINFDIEKLPGHVSKVDGFSQRRGISGGHNSDSFYKAVSDNSVKILSETLTDVEGITHITYQIPTKDRTGKLDGGYKNEVFEKTVYDPKFFSDQKILDLGQKASAKGYKEAMNSKDGQATATVDGVSFRIYVDKTTGKVRNFHPN
ncbi:VENN motif pre-toxin domain-containing protein [Proteus vulgaris]|uniref:VENN motif pre-toxin domain-containing protein n=1 Tax=Proteus vulgaris TaxID=585 RepID=UPI0023605A39|nr:VENN motif pre-toxin domain-containing protein [Proteus vulgaris]